MSALLLVKTLQQEGFTFDRTIVDTKEGLQETLQSNDFHLVLSDYSMPELDCAEALYMIRQKDPDIPFVIVSGKIGEETVVDMMRSGATDFVMKDRMDRLVPVVKRELRNFTVLRERQRSQEKLKQTEEQYRAFVSRILEVIPDGLVVLDGKNQPFQISPAFLEIVNQYASALGYTQEELQNLLIQRALDLVQGEESNQPIEFRVDRKKSHPTESP